MVQPSYSVPPSDALPYRHSVGHNVDMTLTYEYHHGTWQVVDRAGEVLQARGIRSTSIVGGRTRQERSSAVSLFTTEPSIKVILLTTGSAAAGACGRALLDWLRRPGLPECPAPPARATYPSFCLFFLFVVVSG